MISAISKLRLLAAWLVAALTLNSAPSFAQLSITTVGATQAHACYHEARRAEGGDDRPCDQALERDNLTVRDRARTFVNRGIILNRAGRWTKAIADFEDALALINDLPEAFLNRGNAYFLMQRLDEALADYRRSLDLGLMEAHAAWYNIGLIYERLGDASAARGAFSQAIAVKDDFVLAIEKLAQLEAAMKG